jgi:glycosyltransferase involved in cell wall biosynthesis
MVAVSVGLPTYNGATFLRDSLDCLVAQTHPDLEIVISDNASTDGTSEIAAEYAAKYPQIRHFRSETTVPALENFRRAFALSTSPYFLWRADDDLSSPTYIAGLAAALDADPTADLAVSALLRCANGRETHMKLPRLDESSVVAKVESLLHGCRPTWIYGLWRRGLAMDDIMRMIEAYPVLWASDHMQMLPTLLRGAVTFAWDQDVVFQQNIVREASYLLPPREKLVALRQYKKIAVAELEALAYESDDHKRLSRALEVHLEQRVARKWQTTRRAIEASLRRGWGMKQKPNR